MQNSHTRQTPGSARRQAIYEANRQLYLWKEGLRLWLLGAHENWRPTVRRGQWVRFIGIPDHVQTPDQRPPKVGAYGQVMAAAGGRAYVVFLGSKVIIGLGVHHLEPLVGTPVGRPRDHLRKFRRLRAARMRGRSW